MELNARERDDACPGDRFGATVQARYLFGAPMARADARRGLARQATDVAVGARDPGHGRDWYLGESGAWWEDDTEEPATGHSPAAPTRSTRAASARSRSRFPPTPKGRPARVTFEVGVTDVNRQAVGATRSTLVHPAEFYVAAKPLGASYFWQAGTPQSIGVLAVRPDGQKVAGRARAGHDRAPRVAPRASRAERHVRGRGRVGVGHRRALHGHDRRRRRCRARSRLTPAASYTITLHRHGPQRPRGDDELPALGVREATGCRGTTSRSSRWT